MKESELMATPTGTVLEARCACGHPACLETKRVILCGIERFPSRTLAVVEDPMPYQTAPNQPRPDRGLIDPEALQPVAPFHVDWSSLGKKGKNL